MHICEKNINQDGFSFLLYLKWKKLVRDGTKLVLVEIPPRPVTKSGKMRKCLHLVVQPHCIQTQLLIKNIIILHFKYLRRSN